MATKLFWRHLLVLLFCWNTSGSRITLTSSSLAIQPLLTPSLSIRCSLVDTSSSSTVIGKRRVLPQSNPTRRDVTSTPDNAKYVTSVFLFQGGKDIAGVTEHIPVHTMGSTQNVNVSGGIPGTQGDRGFLEVTLAYPTEEHSGNYSCVIAAIDDVGHSVTYSTSVYIDVTNPTISDLVQHIYTEELNNKAVFAQQQKDIADLEQKNIANKVIIDQQQKEISVLQQKDIDNKAMIDQMQHKEDAQQEQITKINQNNQQQEAEIANLKSALDITSHIESGVVTFGNIGSKLGALTSRNYDVKFDRPYTKTPKVHLALMDEGDWGHDESNFFTKLTKVDASGFTVEVSVRYADHYLSYLHVSWISFP